MPQDSKLKFDFGHNISPPDRFRFTCPDGFVVVADQKDLWLRLIKKHEKDNGRALATGWEREAEDQLCRILPPGFCKYDDGAFPGTTVDVRMTGMDWLHGMAVLKSVSFTTDSLVDQETAEARARICAFCPANIRVNGCAPCMAAADFIIELNGGKKTKAENVLSSCAICHCSNKAQVWVKIEHLDKGVDGKQREQFKLVRDFCWKAQELEALHNPQQPA